MTLTFDVPADLEEVVRAAHPDLDNFVREILGIQMFREEVFSHYWLRRFLDIYRDQADALLKKYRVTEQMLTSEDIQADVASLEKLLGPPHDRRRRSVTTDSSHEDRTNLHPSGSVPESADAASRS